MKGVILAGGLGTRLRPLTDLTNKHLLPVYDRPMIHYPVEALREAGIDEILIVTGGRHAGAFFSLLRNGEDFGLQKLQYAYQDGEGGIAQALALAESFADGDDICVILGDNLFEQSLAEPVRNFREQGGGARILLKEVPDPERFGVVRFDGDTDARRVIDIVEKPTDAPSNLAVIGVYFYDSRVFDICRTLKPSARGELEITDVNKAYLEMGELQIDVLEGWWIDAGTFDTLRTASNLVAETRSHAGKRLEPVIATSGWRTTSASRKMPA